jgi:hypothetical protein
MPEFIRFQYYLDNAMGKAEHSLTRRVFDDSLELYELFWNKQVTLLSEAFSTKLRHKLDPYARQHRDAVDIPKPMDITPAFATFLGGLNELLEFVNKEISPDSILRLYMMLNANIWKAVNELVIERNSFNHRGAAQVYYDVTQGLIPLLNSVWKVPKSLGVFHVIQNMDCVNVLNSLKLLSLPSGTSILLKDEVERIPEQMLPEKLKPFDIADISKQRVLDLFAQRCDMTLGGR